MKIPRTASALPALVLLLLTACGSGEATQESARNLPDDLAIYCGEARGGLLEAEWMSEGRQRVDTSNLEAGHWAFSQLADKVQPPADIRADFDRWRAAIGTWQDRRTAIAPTIVDGRLIEPDVTELDRSLMSEIDPLRQRIGRWVYDVCGDP